jgi:hypothetical protein
MFKRLFGGSRHSDNMRKDEPATPDQDWAHGFNDRAKLNRFLARVNEYFVKNGEAVTLGDGWVQRAPSVGSSEPGRFGLTNLAIRASNAPEEEWALIIAEHFDLLERSQNTIASIGENPRLEDVREMLAVRLFHPGYLGRGSPGELAGSYAAREDLPGLLTVLVLDGENWVRTLGRETTDPWGVELSDLFSIGMKNLKGRITYTVKQGQTDGGTDFFILEADSLVASSIVLRLRDVEGMVGTHGSVVSVPLRDLVLVAPLGDTTDPDLCTVLGNMSAGLCGEFEGSISPDLYWTDGQAYIHLGTPDARARLLAHGVPKHVAGLLALGDQ